MSFQVRGPGWPVVALTTAAVVLVLGFSVSTQGPGGGRLTRVNGYEAAEGEVLVKYRDDVAATSQTAIEASADAESVETIDRRGARKLRSRRLRTVELLSLLADDPAVEYAEPNYVVRLDATPNDPSFPSLWGLFNTGLNPVGGGGAAGKDIDAPAAWDTTTGSRANVVAIFDTGVDYTHPDLAANMWSAPSAFQVTVGGVTVTCQAGTHGFNAINRTCDPMDDQYHGTHVAGTIGARGNNGVGVVGVNWTASMMAIKFMGSSGSGYISDAVIGLEFVVQAKAAFAATRGANVRVLSNSWGGGYSQSLMNAIITADGNDMLFVAAAGNNATNNDTAPHYPSSFPTPNMVAVASTNNSDQRSSFSNYGRTTVHLGAPGSAILSTVPGNSYSVLQGTSMATPHVSGAAMLALSMCAVSTPQLKSLLLDNVDFVDALATITITRGRLNVRNAVQNCPYPKVTNITLTSDVPSPQPLGKTVTWTAVPQGGQAPFSYRWWVEVSPDLWMNWGWTSSNTFAWTPTTANASYQVRVQARSAWAEEFGDYAVSKMFAIRAPVSSVTLSSDLTAPQAPGTTVTWTASATGGEAPYEYQFQTYDGSAWTVTRPWSTSNTYAWAPGAGNPNYRVMAQARGTWNSAPSGELAVWKPFPVGAVATSVTLTADMTAPRLPGTTVRWVASASGGQAPYQYQFLVYDGSTWTVVRPWSISGTYDWTPTVANPAYQMVVQVRSAWNTGAKELSTARPFSILPPVTSVSLVPDLASPRGSGTTVTFTATASGGTGPLQYRWILYRSGATIVQNWSTNNVYVWTPTLSSDVYQMKVEVRSGWNSGTTEVHEREAIVNYQIKSVVSVATISPSVSSPRQVGATIRWQANAWGGVQPYQYSFAVWNGTAWGPFTPWSTSNIFDWTPSTANPNYKVGVRVRSAWNTGGAAEIWAVEPFVIQ